MSLFLKHVTLCLKKSHTWNILYSWQFSAQAAHFHIAHWTSLNNVTAVTVNMRRPVTLNALKMAKKWSSGPKNQYIVLFNLLIIRSSLRTTSSRCYMTCWGNLSNYTEILKCCGWKLFPELYVTGSSEGSFFPQLNFSNAVIPERQQGWCRAMFYLL